MTVLFSDETDTVVPFDLLEVAKTVIAEALASEGFPEACEVSLTLTDDETIAELNAGFREIARATDVLSFPMLTFANGAGYACVISEAADYDHDTRELLLGDIVISVPHMLAQAGAYGHSVKREYAFLITHSMLHLMGYDHMEDDERAIMEEKQRQILEKLQIHRETI